jgi:hypothetical protein
MEASIESCELSQIFPIFIPKIRVIFIQLTQNRYPQTGPIFAYITADKNDESNQ